jgi:hypothetical protein
MQQTVFNLILDFRRYSLITFRFDTVRIRQNPSPDDGACELGYAEALDAAVSGDPKRLPDPPAFGSPYGSILAGLRGLHAQVIATTIPNPLDTAYFSSPVVAASITSADPSVIVEVYHVGAQDYVTRSGLFRFRPSSCLRGLILYRPVRSCSPAQPPT